MYHIISSPLTPFWNKHYIFNKQILNKWVTQNTYNLKRIQLSLRVMIMGKNVYTKKYLNGILNNIVEYFKFIKIYFP